MKRIEKNSFSFLLLRILGFSLLMVLIAGTNPSFIISGIFSYEEQMPIMAPLNKEFLQFQKDPSLAIFSRYSDEGYPLGLLPSPHDVSYFKNQLEARIVGLPSSYDLREKNKLTSVKDQGNCGSCWAFATYSSLESFLLPAENWDFSEQNLIDMHGFDYGPCDGGQIYMSAAYLSRWSGPVKEEDDPYIYAAGTFPVRKHIQEIILIQPRSDYLTNDLLKQAVMTYGAVYTTMNWKGTCYNSTYKTYYNPSYEEGPHAVAIVGWDDNFDKNKFNTLPPGNGVFIVRNSWGTVWGESGYFYVSYYDKFFGRRAFNAVVKAETPTNYEVIYQYDPLGLVSSLGYGANTAWFANIFTATSSLPLTAVSFYAAASQNSYEIFIYRDVAWGQPRSGTLTETKIGQLDSPGYFTVQLDKPVDLILNQKFSIVVKLKTTGYNYPIPGEFRLENYSSKAAANTGESFVSFNGDTWNDLHTSWGGQFANSNVCLKAFAGYLPLDAYELTLATSTTCGGTGGTTDPVPGTYTYSAGSDVTITALPNTDYRFSGWTGDVPAGHENDNPVTITMDSNKSVTANFIRQYTLTNTTNTTYGIDGGTTTPVPGTHTYDCGTEVPITALPNTDYRFSGWTGDVPAGHENDNPVTITMDSNKSVTANFIRIIYAPQNLAGNQELNRSLLQSEYINVLSWNANPKNETPYLSITKYRIYQVVDQSKNLLTEVDADIFEYWHRKVEKGVQYIYAICVLNIDGREGDFELITSSGSGTKVINTKDKETVKTQGINKLKKLNKRNTKKD